MLWLYHTGTSLLENCIGGEMVREYGRSWVQVGLN